MPRNTYLYENRMFTNEEETQQHLGVKGKAMRKKRKKSW
jgi:hypothetical protein